MRRLHRRIRQRFLPDFSSCLLATLACSSSGGEAGRERRSHDGVADYVVAIFSWVLTIHLLFLHSASSAGPETIFPEHRETFANFLSSYLFSHIHFLCFQDGCYTPLH